MKLKLMKTNHVIFSTSHMTKKEFKERTQHIIGFTQQSPSMDSEVQLIDDEDTIVYRGMMSKLDKNHYYQALTC